jgi:hypothetical protein
MFKNLDAKKTKVFKFKTINVILAFVSATLAKLRKKNPNQIVHAFQCQVWMEGHGQN